jgi:Rho family GTPase 3
MEEIRIVVVGDEKSGKSTLINRFVSDSLPASYKPTSFDKFLVTREISGALFNLVVWDTSGSPNFDTVRPLSYGEADVFIICFKISDPLSLYNVRTRWLEEIRAHSRAPVLLCGCMADLRTDENTVAHLGRLGRSVVSLDQALAISAQVQAVSYVETAAQFSLQETFQLFSLASVAALESRRQSQAQLQPYQPQVEVGPRPGSVASITRNVPSRASHSSLRSGGQEREAGPGARSVPTSPTKLSNPPPPPAPSSSSESPHCPPLHSRSASQPVRSCEPPRPPPGPPLGSQPALTRKSSFRSSLPAAPLGKPPLPHSQLAKSPTELVLSSRTAITVEPTSTSTSSKSRLNSLGVPEPPTGKLWQESLKSHTSTASHGSTGSKISSSSSQVSHWAGPREPGEPLTDSPQLLNNLEFISPKAGVYRPVNSAAGRSSKKDKCSLM